MTFEPFQIVVVPFPFTDGIGTKRRPALIVSADGFNRRHDQAILAMITTARNSDWPSDVALDDWSDAGLSTVCRVRLKLFTLERTLILKRIGLLTPRDRTAVQTGLSRNLAVGMPHPGSV